MKLKLRFLRRLVERGEWCSWLCSFLRTYNFYRISSAAPPCCTHLPIFGLMIVFKVMTRRSQQRCWGYENDELWSCRRVYLLTLLHIDFKMTQYHCSFEVSFNIVFKLSTNVALLETCALVSRIHFWCLFYIIITFLMEFLSSVNFGQGEVLDRKQWDRPA